MSINGYDLHATFEGIQVKIQLSDSKAKNNSSTLVSFQGHPYSVEISGLNKEMQLTILAILSDPKITLDNIKTKFQSRNFHLTLIEEKISEVAIKSLHQQTNKQEVDQECPDIDFDFSSKSEITKHYFENPYQNIKLGPSRFRFDSGVLVSKKTSNGLNTRELFDLDKAIAVNGNLVISRTIENNFDIYIFDKKSYLVWNNGPKKGYIYRIINKDEMRSFNPPSLNQFHRLLSELAHMQDPKQEDILKQFHKCAIDLFEEKHGDYHLWDAQYFSFSDQDNTIIDYFIEIQSVGFSRWVQNQRFKALEDAPDHIRKNWVPIKRLELRPEIYRELVPNATLPKIFLCHATFSDKLSPIIQLGGLASVEMASRAGIFKTRGGESGGVHSCDSCSVSFWHYPEGNEIASLGFGEREGFEYPITFAVGEKHYKDPNSYNPFNRDINTVGPLKGTMAGEAVARLFWPIEFIDYIFVPPFAISDTYKVLEEHGLMHIKVLPYTRNLKVWGEEGQILKQIFSLEGLKSNLLDRELEEMSFSSSLSFEPNSQVNEIDRKLAKLKKKVSKKNLKLVQELVGVLSELKAKRRILESATSKDEDSVNKRRYVLNPELPELVPHTKSSINQLEKRQTDLEKQIKEIAKDPYADE